DDDHSVVDHRARARVERMSGFDREDLLRGLLWLRRRGREKTDYWQREQRSECAFHPEISLEGCSLYLPAPGILLPQPLGLGGDERRNISTTASPNMIESLQYDRLCSGS